jgi:hypothetical protein
MSEDRRRGLLIGTTMLAQSRRRVSQKTVEESHDGVLVDSCSLTIA